MAAQDNGLFQLEQGAASANIKTGFVFKFNSTQLPGVEAATTAATSSLAGAITAINATGGLLNELKGKLVSLGIIAST